MGIFSLFGKKSSKRGNGSKDKSSSDKTRTSSGNTVITGFADVTPLTDAIIAQRHIARATERKIDAIEFEMSRDIVKARSQAPAAEKSQPVVRHSVQPIPSADQLIQQTIPLDRKPPATEFQTTMPMTMPSDYLLGHPTEMPITALGYTESVPVLEEAAILFASGQVEVAEKMLQSAIQHQNLGTATEIGWQMLFDLYRITHNQYQFESLSLDYANKFETSPPLWPEEQSKAEVTEHKGPASTPSILFPPKLDAGIVKTLEKLHAQSQKSRSLRLDFSRVTAVDPIGCGLLLRTLKNLKKSGHDLMLVAAQGLADKIRAILQVGRRDETEAPWLLLLEILQLLHFERAFEEASMDYCITFEVSPPSFEPPKNNISNAFPEINIAADEAEQGPEFRMPEKIEGKISDLIQRIEAQARQYNPLVLDCSDLQRVEFSASADLLNGLAPIAAEPGTVIQFIEVNYLVMMLFNAMGLKNIASITLRKQ